MNAWLTTYQALLVGLGAVVIGLIGNTILEWLKQYWSYRRAARAVRGMILQELMTAERTAEAAVPRVIDWANDAADNTDMLIPVYERYPVFELYLKDLGHLHGHEIRAVMEAYSYLHAIPEWLIYIATFQRGENRVHAKVTKEFSPVLTGMNKNVLEKVRAATHELRKRIPKSELDG